MTKQSNYKHEDHEHIILWNLTKSLCVQLICGVSLNQIYRKFIRYHVVHCDVKERRQKKRERERESKIALPSQICPSINMNII